MSDAAGLVLAAGAGSRFGGPKALARYRGQTLAARAAALLERGGCRSVLVVLGARADRARRALPAAVDVVVNEDWATGMASSLRVGLDALRQSPNAGAAVVVLADQPLLGHDSVRRLIGAWRAGAVAAVATYEGRRAHPVLFDRRVWQAVSALATADEGARSFLAAHPELVTAVACDGTGDPTDVDTRDELAALQAADDRRDPHGDGTLIHDPGPRGAGMGDPA